MPTYAYRNLSLGFFSTVALHDNGKYLTARMNGNEYKITDKVLCDIYEFDPNIPTCHSPQGFQFDPHWALISPCKKYNKLGALSGLITDLAHVVILRYISHMIFGKKESNKYLKESLYDIHNDTRCGPTLGHVVTKLANHFGVHVDEPKYLAKWFSERDLHHGDFLRDSTHPRPVYKQKAYEAYCKANGLPWPHPSEAGTLAGPDPADSHDNHRDDDEANLHPADDTIQPLLSRDEYAGGSSHSGAPAWFTEYEA
ncbi:7-dimethyl-8-ribityllumazine synthase [Striga asiatica]|uniref:7-dimethyl-8-ribityllumazine synthase n=1 Tax=Striga asiatica TaxID=4170 RepID=A0A5A7QQP0_STRAF|nr:7-dimethyl-8-ribityllumazine synthase [Striga asiatica]